MSEPPGDFLGLSAKAVLVLGLANRKSVAYHVGQVLTAAGAKVSYGVHTPQRLESAAKLLPGAEIHVCDVEHEDQIARLRDEIAARHPKLHGIVHSIAFGDYAGAVRPFHETPKAAFLRAMDVSCYSLIAVANAFRDMLAEDGAVVAISISTTRIASESCDLLAQGKARPH